MERRTLIIIIGILFFIIGIPILFMWTILSGSGHDKYWKINNTGIFIIQKDSPTTEHYQTIRPKEGIDTIKALRALIYFDTEFYAEIVQNNSMLSAATEPGVFGNPQKIKTFQILYSDFYKEEYKDISNFLSNDSTLNYNTLIQSDFHLFHKYHGTDDYHDKTAYIFKGPKQFVNYFNTDNGELNMIGQENTFLSFVIDKKVFSKSKSLFKIKILIEFTDNTKFQKKYYGRLKNIVE
ncbi:MAG: hypothetical protein JNM51_09850 [Bacteroidia bacterium]|nr:hypothetical protein [Bacteroidia bacterium]